MSQMWTGIILFFVLLRCGSYEMTETTTSTSTPSPSRSESRISFGSNDLESEKRLRDRWNAFVAETAKELDFDLRVSPYKILT